MTKNQADVSQIFLIYMATIGDADKTAVACDVDPKFVRKLADQEGWAEKIARLSLLSKSGTPGDWERTQNRALNYVQAHLLRRVVDRQLVLLSNTEATEVLKVTDRDGNTHYSARILTDLAATMQRIHEMTYSALGDSVKERTADVPKDETSKGGLHSSIIAMLNKTGQSAETLPATLADAATDAIASVKEAIPIEATVEPSGPTEVTDGSSPSANGPA